MFSDLELDVALKDHHHFVNGMPIILPSLTGRVSPDFAAETAAFPVGSNCGDVYHCDMGGLSSSCTIKRGFPAEPPARTSIISGNDYLEVLSRRPEP